MCINQGKHKMQGFVYATIVKAKLLLGHRRPYAYCGCLDKSKPQL